MTSGFEQLETPSEAMRFVPTRETGLQRLERFTSRTGHAYTQFRNYDFGAAQRSNVSLLSPWLRHRLITEEEVLTRVLAAHGPHAAEKFIQELFWRGYFKGWLEQHPSVWISYQKALLAHLTQQEQDTALKAAYLEATSAKTGIACFDHWMRELTTTGYLHNHARMWMASIWIFTLRLPWELGADVFMRHLIDADPASNTLSWRWVAGLHTKGKTYLARPDNIAKFTDGRFQPQGLATVAAPLVDTKEHPRVPLPASSEPPPARPYLLLITEEDMAPLALPTAPVGVIGITAPQGRSPGQIGALAAAFTQQAMDNTLAPFAQTGQAQDDWATPLIEAARAYDVDTIVTPFCPIGPTRARLDRAAPQLHAAGLHLHRVQRPYDAQIWPHAKAGFFGLKKKIPLILRALNLAS